MLTCLKGGRIFDPKNGVNGEVRDLDRPVQTWEERYRRRLSESERSMQQSASLKLLEQGVRQQFIHLGVSK